MKSTEPKLISWCCEAPVRPVGTHYESSCCDPTSGYTSTVYECTACGKNCNTSAASPGRTRIDVECPTCGCVDPRVQTLLEASLAYVERVEQHFQEQEQRAKDMQEAANLVRLGKKLEALQITSLRLNLGAAQIPYLDDVMLGLTNALKPFRKRSNCK
jgi:hypothetical protein